MEVSGQQVPRSQNMLELNVLYAFDKEDKDTIYIFQILGNLLWILHTLEY